MTTHQKLQDTSSPSLTSDLNTVGIIPVKPRTQEDVTSPPKSDCPFKFSEISSSRINHCSSSSGYHSPLCRPVHQKKEVLQTSM
ncbi:hypothetical protein INR49_020789 [Caranx melampygus]|nr:hypothetical protein INR49_020789 [Caranx melampygus]